MSMIHTFVDYLLKYEYQMVQECENNLQNVLMTDKEMLSLHSAMCKKYSSNFQLRFVDKRRKGSFQIVGACIFNEDNGKIDIEIALLELNTYAHEFAHAWEYRTTGESGHSKEFIALLVKIHKQCSKKLEQIRRLQ